MADEGGEAAKCRVGATHLHNTLVTQQGKLFAQQEVAQMCKLVEKTWVDEKTTGIGSNESPLSNKFPYIELRTTKDSVLDQVIFGLCVPSLSNNSARLPLTLTIKFMT